ncbi:hypothetical protein GF326_10820 [Candidatus Bathyarchaeota archaeon]|nr:hypothetical protein [Candidatus Bathyarchaeota archaeon]
MSFDDLIEEIRASFIPEERVNRRKSFEADALEILKTNNFVLDSDSLEEFLKCVDSDYYNNKKNDGPFWSYA